MALRAASEQDGTPASPAATSESDADRRARWGALVNDKRNRDPWDRPLIAVPEGTEGRRKDGRKGYRRASSYGSPLEYEGNLTAWKMRQVARGVTHSSVLQLEVTRAEVDVEGQGPAAKRAKETLDGLCQDAMEVVGSGDKARIGTGLHAILERHDTGQPMGHVPPEWLPDVAAYAELTRGRFRTVSLEEFIVEDEWQVAGWYDRCVELLEPMTTPEWTAPDGTVIAPQTISAGEVLIGDVKTAQDLAFAGPKFGCQVREYAAGKPYDPETGVRLEWDDDAGRRGWGHKAPRQDWAIIFSVPSGQGTASIHWVNLTEAADACAQAWESYQWRARRGKALITQAQVVERREDFRISAASAADLEELKAAARRANAVGEWNDDLRAVFSARKAELAGMVAA